MQTVIRFDVADRPGYSGRMQNNKITSSWTGADMDRWRDACGFTKDAAAEAIEVNRATFYRYLTGAKNAKGDPMSVPLTLELACRFVASELGVKLPKLRC